MSSLHQIRLVAGREIRARMRSRAYQLSTLAIVLIAVGGLVAARAVPDFFEEDVLQLGVAPPAQQQGEALATAASAFDREIELVPYPDLDAAQADLEASTLDAVLAEPDRLLFEDEVDPTLEAIVQQSLFSVRLEERAAALGLTLEEAQALIAPVVVSAESLAPAAPEEDGPDAEIGAGLGSLSAIALLFAISFYGQWVLVGVIEEKSNRVVEVLLAAVAPWELLVGKVLGILALAIAQFAAGVIAFVVAAVALDGWDLIPTVALAGLALAVLWLVIGLLLYNFLYAAVGATVNRPEEATSASFPLMIPLFAGYFVGLLAIPESPDSVLARVLSLFPLTSPLTMPSRIASGGGSPAEVVLAVVLALGALAGVIWLAGRIYSGGILQSSRVGLLAAFRGSRDVR